MKNKSSQFSAIKNHIYIAFLLMPLMLLFIGGTIKKKSFIDKLAAEYAIAFAWFLMGYWWIAVIVSILGILYLISKRPLLVRIIKENISYPSFPQKKLSWSELNNIILKDGLLTIEFKNNKFVQQPVDESKTSINEQDVNDFCREHLNK